MKAVFEYGSVLFFIMMGAACVGLVFEVRFTSRTRMGSWLNKTLTILLESSSLQVSEWNYSCFFLQSKCL